MAIADEYSLAFCWGHKQAIRILPLAVGAVATCISNTCTGARLYSGYAYQPNSQMSVAPHPPRVGHACVSSYILMYVALPVATLHILWVAFAT